MKTVFCEVYFCCQLAGHCPLRSSGPAADETACPEDHEQMFATCSARSQSSFHMFANYCRAISSSESHGCVYHILCYVF